MTSSMLRRQLKNLVQNYSEAEVKVREATSNDPWGPSSSQMADISDLTYNVVACNEIMTMLWKRLKDDRNWRHIHKSLTLLEYLLKTGDDRVLLKMKDNIYIVKALTEYRFVEKDGKDQGANVREKAKVVLVLMEDDEKLKEERDFAVKTREKTSKGSAASSTDAAKDPSYKPVYVPGATGLPSLTNIPSVADLTASFAARKEERLKQEAEKKEVQRRANMSEDELKWEDAGKGGNVEQEAWGEDKKEEEVKRDAWGAPVTSDTSDTAPPADAWGDSTKSEESFDATKDDEDPFAVSKTEEDKRSPGSNDEDPFAKDKPDPFSASKDDAFNASKENSDPFNAPKDKEDPFAAPKDKPDPFASSNNDPFNAPKDDPFNTPKDDPFNTPKDDPFNTPKDDPFSTPKDDPFNTPKDDPFNTPKEDPFNTPKDDPFSTPKDDPFNTPKDDPFKAPKDDPFNAPKDDPFNTPKEDPFNTPKDDPFTTQKEDPFSTPKDDPFNTPKDDQFNAPASTPPKEDPFAAPASAKEETFTASPSSPSEDPFTAATKPSEDDPFMAPATSLKEDPFSTPTAKDDPFTAATSPPKEDSFTDQPSPPKDDASDPFSAQPVSSPKGKSDSWEVPASSPPATASDPWGTSSAPNETTGGDPWGDDKGSFSPVDSSDAFGDSSKPDSDPWGAPAAVKSDDAWGSPAPPSDSSPSADPFGDGSKKDDAWGALSNDQGKLTRHGKEVCGKTASFLGSKGASLIDLDDLFSFNTKPKQQTLGDTLAVQAQAIGTLTSGGPTSAQLSSPGAVSGLTYHSLFESDFAPPVVGAAGPSHKSPLLLSRTAREPSFALRIPQSAPSFQGNAGGGSQVALNVVGPLPGPVVGKPPAGALMVDPSVGQCSYPGENQPVGITGLGGLMSNVRNDVPTQPQMHSGMALGGTVRHTNHNPFQF